jgi:hypothetical protein
MTQYFFDLGSADTFSRVEEGIELPDAEAAHDMAPARSSTLPAMRSWKARLTSASRSRFAMGADLF